MSLKFIVGDVETFYDTRQNYTLKKMMTQAYIEDPKAHEIMWAFGEAGCDKGDVKWGYGASKSLIKSFKWDETVFIGHNAQFDAAVLNHFHNVKPKRVLCTMAMAQTLGIQKITGSLSLATLGKFFALDSQKGHEVLNADGKSLGDFSYDDLQAYKEYNINDVWMTGAIFELLRPYITKEELLWHSCVNKMFSEPKITLDTPRLEKALIDIKRRKAVILDELQDYLDTPDHKTTAKVINSNATFIPLLEDLGVKIPLKKSHTTGKMIPAFAASDRPFKALMGHENDIVAMLCKGRASIRSNMEERRIERLILLSLLPSHRFRIPHKISGAHTLRGSGIDNINIQNLPSGRKEGQSKEGRRSIKAPKGYKVAAPDSGQIEARLLAIICGDVDMIDTFAEGKCPYSKMASKVYPVSAAEIKKGDGLYKATQDKDFKKFYLYRQTGKAAVLQLGFAAGSKGFYRSLRDIYQVTTVSKEEAAKIHQIYGQERVKVVEMWETCKKVLHDLTAGGSGYFGGLDGKLFYYTARYNCFGTYMPGIRLPNQTWLTYPGLYCRAGRDMEGKLTGFDEYAYFKDLKKYNRALGTAFKDFQAKKKRKPTLMERHVIKRRTEYKQATRIWHGTVIENLCQALAFAILKWQGIHIAERMPNCFNVHDEFVIMIPEHSAEEFAEKAKQIMEALPPWSPKIKLECEYKIADNYGDT